MSLPKFRPFEHELNVAIEAKLQSMVMAEDYREIEFNVDLTQDDRMVIVDKPKGGAMSIRSSAKSKESFENSLFQVDEQDFDNVDCQFVMAIG